MTRRQSDKSIFIKSILFRIRNIMHYLKKKKFDVNILSWDYHVLFFLLYWSWYNLASKISSFSSSNNRDIQWNNIVNYSGKSIFYVPRFFLYYLGCHLLSFGIFLSILFLKWIRLSSQVFGYLSYRSTEIWMVSIKILR